MLSRTAKFKLPNITFNQKFVLMNSVKMNELVRMNSVKRQNRTFNNHDWCIAKNPNL